MKFSLDCFHYYFKISIHFLLAKLLSIIRLCTTYSLWVMCCFLNKQKWGELRPISWHSYTGWPPDTSLQRCQRKLEPGIYGRSPVSSTLGMNWICNVRMQDFLSDLHWGIPWIINSQIKNISMKWWFFLWVEKSEKCSSFDSSLFLKKQYVVGICPIWLKSCKENFLRL